MASASALHHRRPPRRSEAPKSKQEPTMQRARSAPVLHQLLDKSWHELEPSQRAQNYRPDSPYAAPRAPRYRQAPGPKDVNRAIHRPPPPVITLAAAVKSEALPRPSDRMMMHRVQTKLDSIQGSIAFPVRDKLDTSPGFRNLSRPKQREMRELLQVNPHMFNHARYYTWKTRHVREMVDDIKLAAASAAVVRMKVARVRQIARQRDPGMFGVQFPKDPDNPYADD